MNILQWMAHWLERLAAFLIRIDDESRMRFIRCRGCGRWRILGGLKDQFHYIVNFPKTFIRTFPYCEECHNRLSIPEKKILIWGLIVLGGEGDEKEALKAIARGSMLCAQIDKGL